EAEENIKNAAKEAQEVTQKRVLTELRAKYGKELENALAAKALLERRHESIVRQLETDKQELGSKLGTAEEAIAKLQVNLQHTEEQKKSVVSAHEDVSRKLSASQETITDLESELRRKQTEKQGLEIRLQHVDAKRIEAEQAASRMLTHAGETE